MIRFRVTVPVAQRRNLNTGRPGRVPHMCQWLAHCEPEGLRLQKPKGDYR